MIRRTLISTIAPTMTRAVTTTHTAHTQATEFLLRWPKHEPLAALVSGGALGAQNGWSFFARPSETIVIGADIPREAALKQLATALERTPRRSPERVRAEAPFCGGWIMALGYDLGACFEPHASANAKRDTASTPRALLHWCEDAWCFDHLTGVVHAVGSPPMLASEGRSNSWELTPLRQHESDALYAQKVSRAIEYIHAGDAFQANIARRFDASVRGNVRAFAHDAIAENHAWFGAYLEQPNGGALVSVSPELFLRVRGDGRIVTRPIKGTRAADVASQELVESTKDAAELAMIVDLMRNDLGRVATIGSVAVTESRMLETHRTVHHGVAEVSAQLRDDASWMDLLRATFPPGSVTGAPKVRAMQIIDELEATPRGFYCGCIGFVSKSGYAAMSVAIRTAQLSAPRTTRGESERELLYHAGCGIVADSRPAEEVAESHAKARALAQLAR